MFFELIFIIWVVRSYYLWKKKINEKYDKDFMSQEFYKTQVQKKKDVFNEKIREKEGIDYRELRSILIEVGNLQRNTFGDCIKELGELLNERTENIADIQEFFGKDDENPVEWIEKFNRVAEVNN